MSNSRNSLVPTIYTSATTSLLVSSTNNFKGKEEKKEKWLSPLISISGGLGIRSWQVYTILFSSLFWIRSWQVYTILLSSLCEISFISHIYYILPLVLTFFFLFMKFHYFSIIKYINTNVYDCACLTYLLYLTVSPLLLFFFFLKLRCFSIIKLHKHQCLWSSCKRKIYIYDFISKLYVVTWIQKKCNLIHMLKFHFI